MNILDIVLHYIEIPILFGLILIYIGLYLYGRKTNQSYAISLLSSMGPAIEEHFARVGSYSVPLQNQNAASVEETANSFYTFVSGHQKTLGALIQFNLVPRQELFSYAYSFYDPSGSFDTLTLNLFFAPGALDTFTWGIYRTFDKAAYLTQLKDVIGRDVPPSRPSSLDNRYSVISDTKELMDDSLIPAELLRALTSVDTNSQARGVGLVSLSIVDDATGAQAFYGDSTIERLEAEMRKCRSASSSNDKTDAANQEPLSATAASVARVPGAQGLMQLVFRIPTPTLFEKQVAQTQVALQSIVHTTMRIVDVVTRRKISSAAREANVTARTAPFVKARKEISLKLEAEAKAQRQAEEQKRKAEAYERMTPEQRKKVDEVEAKERAKEQNRKLKRQIMRM